jgi:hypothetical protein
MVETMAVGGPARAQSLGLALLTCLASLTMSVEAPAAEPSVPALPAPVVSAHHELASQTVVLVAIDGVRWQEVFGGVDRRLAVKKRVPLQDRLDAAHLVPNLHRLMTTDGAAIGASPAKAMRASGPNYVSLPGYIEMLTGRRNTGCASNRCGDVRHPTVADDVAEGGRLAAVVASWPGILHAASFVRGRVVTSIGRTGGDKLSDFENDFELNALLPEGEKVPPHAARDFRSDASTGSIAGLYLESHHPTFLFVGLGETDAYAHQGNYRAYLQALHRADAIVGRLAEQVAALNAAGHPSTLMVTTDHGRSYAFATHGGGSPESGRVWLVATGAGIRARGPTSSGVPRHLSDVSQTLRRMLGLPIVQASSAGQVMTELFVAPGKTVAIR